MTTDTEDDICLSDAWVLDRNSRSWSRGYGNGTIGYGNVTAGYGNGVPPELPPKHTLLTRCNLGVRRSSSTPMPVIKKHKILIFEKNSQIKNKT
jgi:hypothetical protein